MPDMMKATPAQTTNDELALDEHSQMRALRSNCGSYYLFEGIHKLHCYTRESKRKTNENYQNDQLFETCTCIAKKHLGPSTLLDKITFIYLSYIKDP